jgi:acyl carrier protein
MNTNDEFSNKTGRGQALDRIQQLISQVCLVDVSEVKRNARLMAFGIDSVRVIELMMSVEEEFQIQLEPAELNDISTVGQLADYVERIREFRPAG